MNEWRIFKGDRHTREEGGRIPAGALVRVVHFYPKRRVWVEFNGEVIGTMLWCLRKVK